MKLYEGVVVVDGKKIVVWGDTQEGAERTAELLAATYRKTLERLGRRPS